MASPSELTRKFWRALKSDRTVMLGLSDGQEHRAQPMTAYFEGDEGGPLYIFTSKESDLVKEMGERSPALIHFVSKGHDLFASVEGDLSRCEDRALVDRLWNPFVAAWYEGGKEDPSLQLIRFDPGHAQIWLNENGLFAGLKMLLGADVKQDYKDKIADVNL